ncbi:tankyrase-1 [Caerostris extrusa]|uniref:Tankyrase-1 n=1 Tax=Caerostris extrusa TaxID=172846 RepID=A0AAV4U2J7_CAEEX|nr:tankyrase-1 [Caerostris extrusa]
MSHIIFQSKIREIHQAVSQGKLRDVQHLIDRKKLAFCRDHNGASPLHKAVIFGHQDIIEYLVKRYGGVIHIRDHNRNFSLEKKEKRSNVYKKKTRNGRKKKNIMMGIQKLKFDRKQVTSQFWGFCFRVPRVFLLGFFLLLNMPPTLGQDSHFLASYFQSKEKNVKTAFSLSGKRKKSN